jgi:methionyl-tRNA formyltransferase
MRVVFMGTPDFAVGTLEALVEAGHEVVAVVTQPDKPKGRGGAMSMSAVKEAALKHSLTVLQPQRARDAAFVAELATYQPEVMVVVAFGQILTSEILHMPKYGCINVHASILPKYRGAAPIQWAVIDGCEYAGVTTMQMDEGIDTGDILLVGKVKLEPKETGGSLFDKLGMVGARLLIKTLEAAVAGELTPVKQNQEAATYVTMISKSFGEINFEEPAEKIERLIRGLNPWPSAYTHLDGKIMKIWDADVIPESLLAEAAVPDKVGTIIEVDKDSFIIRCKTGALKVHELQMEGKKRMTADAFLRGYSLETGLQLG